MGVSSCDNSVMVEEPLCVAVSGQRLCSEFAMQSVSDQQACSELIGCPDPVSDDGSVYPSSGKSLQMCPVDRVERGDEGAMAVENLSEIESVPGGSSLEENPNSGGSIQMYNATGDGSTNEHEDEGTLALENISKTNSMASVSSLEENPNSDGFIQMCITTTDGSANEHEDEVTLALENRSKTNSMPSVSSSEENPNSGGSIQMCNTTRDGSTNEHEGEGTLVLENILKANSMPSVSSSASSGESVQMCTVAGNGSPSEHEDESTLALENVSIIASMASVSYVEERNQSSGESMQMCTVTGDGFTGEREDECTLASPDEDDVGSLAAIGGCLSENHSDVDARLTEKAEKCSEDIEAQVSVAVENLTSKRKSSLEVTTVVSLARGGSLSENRTEVDDCASGRVGEPLKNNGSEGEGVKLDVTALAGSSIQGNSNEYHSDQERSMGFVADGGCLDENHSDIAACTTEMSVGFTAESRVGKSDIREVASVSGYASKGCSDKIHDCIDEISSERVGEYLQERAEIRSELPREAIAMADLVSGGCLVENLSEIDSCSVERSENHIDSFSMQRDGDHLQVSSSKGEGVFEHITRDCDFPLKVRVSNAEHIKEAADDKDEALAADVNCKSYDQEPSLQASESPELVPLDGMLRDTHGTEELYSVRVTGPSMVDMCNKISPLQSCEVSPELSHSGEELGNCDWKNYPSKCIVLPSNGMKTEDVRAESNADTFSQVSLATSQEDVHRSDTLSICVPGYEHNEKVVDIPSVNGVTESVEKETCVISDAMVQVCGPVPPLEVNPCNDVSASQLSQPYNTDNCSSERFSLVHFNGLLDHHKCTSSVGCFERIDNQGKDTDVLNCVSEVKVCEIVSSSSQRSGRRSRSNRKTRAKKGSGKSRKTAKALSPKIGLEIAFKPAKKRSSFRSARSSAWGLLENVAQVFVSWNGVKDVIPVSNKRSRKSKAADKQNEKGKKNGATARAQGSSKRCPPLNTKLRFKVKIGIGANQSLENAMVQELVDTSALSTAICDRYGTELCTNPPRAEDGRKGEASAHFMCLSSNEDNTCPGDTHGIADSSRDLVSEKLSADSSNKLCGVSSNILVEVSESTESKSKDPGTSPDSEVINMIPDSHTDSRPHDDFGGVASSPKDPAAPGGLTNKRGEKKAKSPQAARKSRAKPVKQCGGKQKCNNGICYEGNLNSSAIEYVSSNLLSSKEPSMVEPSLVSKETVVRLSTGALKGESRDCDLDTEDGLSKSETFKKPPSASKSHKRSDSRIEKVKAPPNKGENPQRSVGNKKTSKKSFDNQVTCMVENQPEAENNVVDNNGKTNTVNGIWSTQEPNLDLLPRDVGEPHKLPRNAWVRCDSCHKWRRIAAELADLIEETQCSWTCKDNLDKSFADCSTPQEKSNSDINAELDISDASGEEDAFGNRLTRGLECTWPREKQETVTCTTIRTNQFLHRNRKTQTIDETMICHCKAPSEGRLGCGEDCLNRMLNIECAQGVCPCGDLCSNQQFQKRKYAKLDKFHCGKKGYGLKLQEDIPQGKFLIEYVGEVLDMQAYEARQKEYALKGHKHFYFMTLNGSEVIDACIKGNKGRFINHSCDPNCRTEKWMVNGEICIGLFALRDMKKGEEVTFDYNYVRVFGAAAKKCYCLSPNCRGYIGGDPLSGDVIIQSDSDEDHPKPRRRRDNIPGQRDNSICKARSSGDIIKQTADLSVQNLDEGDKIPHEFGLSETSIEEDFINHTVSPIHDPDTLVLKEKASPSVTPSEISQQTEDIANDDGSIVEKESSLAGETTVKEPEKSLSDDNYAGMMSKSDNMDERKLSSKVHSRVKTSRSPSSVKKERVKSSPKDASKVQLAANKSQVVPLQPKKGNESLLDSRFEAVEEKLNELLEPEGGISRRKDAAKGYLKLLLHTSMSNHESIQRNRDLSMILDALLKTRSRMVLVDIINKNGLRMLHNIMKQHRGDFKKIPILRKLLKVLEYLAYRDILTVEHIREDPPRPGMESFRESILSLTEHDDRQVHQIARNFRDRWIPKHLRRNCFLDRDENKPEYISRSSRSNRYSPTHYNGSDHHSGNERSSESARSDHTGMSSEPRGSSHSDKNSESNDRVKQPTPTPETPSVGPGTMDGAGVGPRIRKRKSRWDQPADMFAGLTPLLHKELKVDPSLAILETSAATDNAQNEILEDFPPGFSSPVKPCLVPPAATSAIPRCSPGTLLGHPQDKFISRLPVSYGIPISIVQKFGTPLEEEASGRWAVAPGMPFHPFPPLPPFPREVKHASPSGTAEEAAPDIRHSNSNDCSPSMTDDQSAVQNGSFSGKRGREPSYDLGTRYFKQQKLRPAWHWSRNAWGGCVGDSRGETNINTTVSLGYVTNDLTPTVSCSEDSSNQHQDHQTQN